MPQVEEQHEQFEAQDHNVSDLDVAEFSVLSPTQALFFSALSTGNPERHGYCLDDVFQIILPERVWQALGFCPSLAVPVESAVDTYRLLFAPVSADGRHTYWHNLFPEDAPKIVMEFLVDRGDAPPSVTISDGWLEWPWWFSSEERQSCLEFAQKAYEQLFDEINWLELIEQSATTGPRSALFEGVAEHLAAQTGINDTV
jgi:hypothetical protein